MISAVVISALSTLTAIMSGSAVLFLVRANRRKTYSEAAKTEAETPFVGAQYVRDLSEAAAALAPPLRVENDVLRMRLEKVEATLITARAQIDALVADNMQLRRDLHSEREERQDVQLRFAERIEALLSGGGSDVQTETGPDPRQAG